MRLKKKRCQYCHSWFVPDPRVAKQQKVCHKDVCCAMRKAATDRDWWQRHGDYGSTRTQKIRTWARDYPNYWRDYRTRHPVYRIRDNRRRRLQHRRAAKQVAIAQSSVEQVASTLRIQQECIAREVVTRASIVKKLACIPRYQPKSAAKQVAIDPRVDAVIEAFLVGQSAAKQDDMAFHGLSGP